MLHRQQEIDLRANHKSFYCPSGHSNYFPGKTKIEKEFDDLKRQVSFLKKGRDLSQESWKKERELRDNLTRAIQICPLGCGHVGSRRLPYNSEGNDLSRFLDRVYGDLSEHLIDRHNATSKPQKLLTA
jgi:hypothetical protein